MRGLMLALLLSVLGAAWADETPTFRSVELDGTTMKVTLNDGSVVPRDALLGMVLTLKGNTKVRIDHIEVDAADTSGEIMLHQFAVQPPDSSQWGNPCPPGPDGRRLGIMLAGTWDSAGRHTGVEGQSLACTATPQAKCVRLGYKPWKVASNGASLAGFHRACVHALRGDFCGDGRARAPDGVTLDISDAAGLQKAANEPQLEFEAGWGPEGAVCVHHARGLQAITLDALGAQCPRLKDRLGAVCTAEAASALGTALVFTRSIPR